MPLFGAHESVAGGLHLAFDRIKEVGGESLQIFTRNQRQWKAAPLQAEEISNFKEAWRLSGNMPLASHASYLVNLAAGDPEKAVRSVQAFSDELQRCIQLGINYVVIHPGSHGGAGVEVGLAQVAKNLTRAIEKSGVDDTELKILLETTAGQGKGLGSQFDELGWLLQNCKYKENIGVCVDSCHVFAAGYDFRDEASYQVMVAALESNIGFDNIHFFHLNDSKKECGSRVDRHEHIGKGCIGLEGFRLLVNDSRFAHVPMALETPKGKDLAEDRANLKVLRSLLK